MPILIVYLSVFGLKTNAQIIDMEVSASTFSIVPKVGTPAGHSRSGNNIEEVYEDLKSTLFLFKQGDNKLCLVTSPLGVHYKGSLHEFCVEKLSAILKIPEEAIITNSSHNHTIPFLDVSNKERPEEGTPELLSWELGREFMTKFENAAMQLNKNLCPVTVEWGVAEENRITYNRKGVRFDGTTYFMREEDRLAKVGKGYHGLIDSDAAVVVFKDYKEKPVAALTFFTGHPVAAYNPEKMISYGQFPQTASEKLSNYLGGIPVGFVQGCAGNINAKYMLTGTIDEAKQLGEYLGETFILATELLQPSKRIGLEWKKEIVNIPLAILPNESKLKKDLDSIDDFIRRGKAGDENTLECVGMNFPLALTPPYRANLIEGVRPWYVWALEMHKKNKLNDLPKYFPLEIVVARFGDVGFVGMPFEPFVETGLKIKREAALPYVLTCGYTDGSYGYIPDADGVDDLEYMSGSYRYRQERPPYKAPGGDACAEEALKIICKFAR